MFLELLNPSEFLGFVLCIILLIYVIFNQKVLFQGNYVFFTIAFLCITGSFFLTNAEEFLLEGLFNVLEHTLSAVGALYVAIGCRRLLVSGRDEGKMKP